MICRKNHVIGYFLPVKCRTRTVAAGFHPKHWQQFAKLSANTDRSLIQKSELEVDSIRFESITHGNVAAKIIAFQRILVYIVTLNRADCTRPCDIAGNTQLLPFFIARLISLFRERFCFCIGDFVIRHHDTAAMSAVLGVQQIDSMKCGTTACEEVYNECVRLV